MNKPSFVPFWVVFVALLCCLSACGGAPQISTRSQATASNTIGALRTTTSAPTQTGTQTEAATVPSAPPGAGASGIESFGRPAGSSEHMAIASAVRGYILALSDDDGAAACADMTAPLRAQVTGVGSDQTGSGPQDCAGTVSNMFAGQPSQTREVMRGAVVGAIRVEGTHAFAIFSQKGQPVSFYPMQLEAGQWRMSALGPTPLPGTASGP